MWIQLNFWVHSWPVFYAIMNGIGHIFLAKAGLTQALGNGEGLSIATQNGLSDAAYDAYCWVMGLQLSVPFISWAFISKSGYAITQMATSITQGLEGFANKIGSETADGNISFDTQSFHNRTIGSYQMAQQQLGSNHNFARVVNDGSLAKTYGDHGALSAQANLSNMATNMVSNFNAAATASESYQESAQLAYQNTRAFAERIASGKTDLHNFSEQEANDMRKASEDFLRADSSLAQNHNISAQTRSDMMLRGNISGKWDGGVVGKALHATKGVSGEIGASGGGGWSADASNQEQWSKAAHSSAGQQLSASSSKLLQFSKNHSDQFSDSKSNELVDTINRSHMAAQNWSNVASYAETKGITTTTNETDNALQYVADQRFSGNKDEAIHWANQHRGDFEHVAAEYATGRSHLLKSFVGKADHVLSDQEISAWMDPSHLPKVESYQKELTPEDLRFGDNQNSAQGLSPTGDDQFFGDTQRKVATRLSNMERQLEDTRHHLESQRHDLEHQHQKKDKKSNFRNAASKGWKDIKRTLGK